MYQVDLIKGEILKYQKVKKIVIKLQTCKVDIVGFLRYDTQFGYFHGLFSKAKINSIFL